MVAFSCRFISPLLFTSFFNARLWLWFIKFTNKHNKKPNNPLLIPFLKRQSTNRLTPVSQSQSLINRIAPKARLKPVATLVMLMKWDRPIVALVSFSAASTRSGCILPTNSPDGIVCVRFVCGFASACLADPRAHNTNINLSSSSQHWQTALAHSLLCFACFTTHLNATGRRKLRAATHAQTFALKWQSRPQKRFVLYTLSQPSRPQPGMAVVNCAVKLFPVKCAYLFPCTLIWGGNKICVRCKPSQAPPWCFGEICEREGRPEWPRIGTIKVASNRDKSRELLGISVCR